MSTELYTASDEILNDDGESPFPLYVENDLAAGASDASIDPLAGGTLNGKPIWSADQVAAYLNRTGAAFAGGPGDAPQSDGDLSVINFGFFESQEDLFQNGYVYFVGTSGFGFPEYFNFAAFSDAQKAAAREAMTNWDDLISPSLVETNVDVADIAFGNLASAPTTQAYAYLPRDPITANPAINVQIRDLEGDVWVSLSQPSNLRLDEGQYGIHTLVHEAGHALGLSHPGAYNAAPGLSITYPVNAEYAQDTRAYSVMSYFEANSISGTRHFDFNISTTVYAATPLIHDILAIQKIYGADMTTRTGDTTYGFNSNAGRDSFDFTLTPAPIMAIWDAGGIDTLDASGYATDQVIDLNPGSLSSIGGVTYDTAPSFEQVNANRLAAGLAPVPLATYNANMAALLANPVVGRLTNNVGIAYGANIENAVGGSGHDNLIGNSLDNILTGNAGNDIIAGAAGNDTMIGGTGNDTYMVDAAGDVVTELGGEGTDTVYSSVSLTLSDNVEELILTGTATNGTGNALDNAIYGNGLDNRLDGGTGNDTLIGGLGDDLFIVDSADDMVAELYDEGTDTVSSSVSLTLAENVENLILTGAATNGTGNELDNVITGNALGNRLSGGAGNDRLIGGDGVDVFTGGAGSDTFVGEINGAKVSSKSGQISLDVVTDFRSGTDKIDLSGIDAISGGNDQAFNFKGTDAAKNAGDLNYKVYNSVNGAENALGIDLDGMDGPSSYTGPVTVIFGNVDGGAPDFAIALFNTNGVVDTDFLF